MAAEMPSHSRNVTITLLTNLQPNSVCIQVVVLMFLTQKIMEIRVNLFVVYITWSFGMCVSL